jgi:WD repeat and SOF domain-containing protein 1
MFDADHISNDIECCRRRHLPKAIYGTLTLKQTMLDSQKAKEERRRQHSRAGESKPKAERKKFVIAEQT